MPLVLAGATSGSITIDVPATAGTNTLSLPAVTDTLVGLAATQTLTNKTLTSPALGGTPTGVGVLTSGTAVASTSGTSIDFTGIPSWVKRVTVMFSGVSTNGSSNIQIQLGDSGGFETTGYLGAGCYVQNAGTTGASTSTSGFVVSMNVATTTIIHGVAVISLLNPSTNLWTFASNVSRSDAASVILGSSSKGLSDILTQVRITTVNGTDAFDAGSINILYE